MIEGSGSATPFLHRKLVRLFFFILEHFFNLYIFFEHALAFSFTAIDPPIMVLFFCKVLVFVLTDFCRTAFIGLLPSCFMEKKLIEGDITPLDGTVFCHHFLKLFLISLITGQSYEESYRDCLYQYSVKGMDSDTPSAPSIIKKK
jgi:hypothetical protein